MWDKLTEKVYPSWDKQYFNEKWELVKTDLWDVEIEYNPKRVTRKM